jgi:hypothetical protein
MALDRAPLAAEPGTAGRLQVLATEHWSLLATRSLTYTEALGRVTIFLAILSGAVITLALVAQADQFGPTFAWIAIPLLAVVLFTGAATVARLSRLNREDYRWVIGMNRLRHAYLERHPELEPFLITSANDDVRGAMQTLGVEDAGYGTAGSILHLVQTLPGMLSVIVASVGGAIGALAAIAAGSPVPGVLVAAAVGFVIVIFPLGRLNRTSIRTISPLLEPRFPSPGSGS